MTVRYAGVIATKQVNRLAFRFHPVAGLLGVSRGEVGMEVMTCERTECRPRLLPEEMGMDDSELIAAARRGDENAFAELYRRHCQYVRAIGRSVLRTDDLDDMCQETFLSAFIGLGSFEGNAQFRTWISRIALNRCLAILRNHRRLSNGEHQVVGMEKSEGIYDVCSVDARLEGLAQRLDMEKGLRRLTLAQRDALEMAYLEGMPLSEIAASLNTTIAAVKGRIAIAKKKLKNLQRD
jgi:RNA polymerase sigma-70 factor, ECF subfamily